MIFFQHRKYFHLTPMYTSNVDQSIPRFYSNIVITQIITFKSIKEIIRNQLDYD